MRPMPRRTAAPSFLLVTTLFATAWDIHPTPGTAQIANGNAAKLPLHEMRSSSLDLEVTGALAGLPAGAKRYLRREELATLPVVDLTVTDDPNFRRPVKVKGIELDLLARALAAEAETSVIVALCTDQYRSYYPQAYRDIHKPVLAMEIDGKGPSAWPQNPEVSGLSMGPYLVTQANFAPAFKILAHEDEAQIPWGVTQLEFRNQKSAFADIAPQGPTATDPGVQAGYRISQQNCLRCHGPESDEPLKGKLTWAGVAIFAAQAPKNFAAYVRNPQAVVKDARMPPNPSYDDATIDALTAYFRTFAVAEKR
jgi:mono/diheme cytochrome c family protein